MPKFEYTLEVKIQTDLLWEPESLETAVVAALRQNRQPYMPAVIDITLLSRKGGGLLVRYDDYEPSLPEGDEDFEEGVTW